MSVVPSWRRNTQLFAALPKTTSTIGLYVKDVGGLGQVQIGDGTITVRYATRYRPRPGEGVILTFFGNQVRITGPTAARDSVGKITAVHASTGLVDVTCDGKSYSMPYTQSYENQSNTAGGLGPLVGDTVSINWDGTAYVIDKLTATVTPPTVLPLTSSQRPFTRTFAPTQSGSYTSAKNKWTGRTTDLFCDSAHQAAWFYGTKLKDTLKNAALIESVEIYLSLRTKKGVEPSIGRHSDASEQAGGVSLSELAVRGWKGWIPLPTAWGDDWRVNVGGVGITGGSSIYRGIGTDHQSGHLRIRGRQ